MSRWQTSLCAYVWTKEKFSFREHFCSTQSSATSCFEETETQASYSLYAKKRWDRDYNVVVVDNLTFRSCLIFVYWTHDVGWLHCAREAAQLQLMSRVHFKVKKEWRVVHFNVSWLGGFIWIIPHPGCICFAGILLANQVTSWHFDLQPNNFCSRLLKPVLSMHCAFCVLTQNISRADWNFQTTGFVS